MCSNDDGKACLMPGALTELVLVAWKGGKDFKRTFMSYLHIFILLHRLFPGGSDGKESAFNPAGDQGSIPGWGRPLQPRKG